jgi:hypothetical protein
MIDVRCWFSMVAATLGVHHCAMSKRRRGCHSGAHRKISRRWSCRVGNPALAELTGKAAVLAVEERVFNDIAADRGEQAAAL